MIQVMLTIDENEPFGQFLIARAHETGRAIQEVAQTEPAAGFQARVQLLHERFLRGELSQGDMADQLGISRVDLIHLLDSMNLASANV